MNLSGAILQLKTIGIRSLADIELVDPPKPEAISSAISELKSLGAIDDEEKITAVGKCMALLPVEPIYGKLIVTAAASKEFQGVLSEIVAIVAMIACQHVFYSRGVRFGERSRGRRIRERSESSKTPSVTTSRCSMPIISLINSSIRRCQAF